MVSPLRSEHTYKAQRRRAAAISLALALPPIASMNMAHQSLNPLMLSPLRPLFEVCGSGSAEACGGDFLGIGPPSDRLHDLDAVGGRRQQPGLIRNKSILPIL